MENTDGTVVQMAAKKPRRPAARKTASSARTGAAKSATRRRPSAARRKTASKEQSFESVIRNIAGSVAVARAAIAEASGRGRLRSSGRWAARRRLRAAPSRGWPGSGGAWTRGRRRRSSPRSSAQPPRPRLRWCGAAGRNGSGRERVTRRPRASFPRGEGQAGVLRFVVDRGSVDEHFAGENLKRQTLVSVHGREAFEKRVDADLLVEVGRVGLVDRRDVDAGGAAQRGDERGAVPERPDADVEPEERRIRRADEKRLSPALENRPRSSKLSLKPVVPAAPPSL